MTTNPISIPTQPEVILMLDIETLATSSEKAVVSQAALIGYDLDQDEIIPIRHHQYYPLDPQIKAGRVVDADTIIWWMTQPDAARSHFIECASDDPEELPALLRNLQMMFRDLVKNRPYEIYANSPNFDCTIMKSLFNDHGMQMPWDFRMERDLRTLCSQANINPKEVPHVSGFIPHNAYWDCRQQIAIYLAARHALRTQG